jgi:Kef-type K+ transport system membrane component KefB/predicted transcriptional regulator
VLLDKAKTDKFLGYRDKRKSFDKADIKIRINSFWTATAKVLLKCLCVFPAKRCFYFLFFYKERQLSELLNNILAHSVEHLNIILLMGLAIFFGTAGARIFQKFRIPQVVGYVVIGLIIGESGLNLIGRDTVEALSSFNMFALGIIGFMIGGELRRDVFKKYGKQFFIILCSEAVAAFILVAVLSCFVSWYFTGDFRRSVAMALVLGAIASATAPAATVNVLWEYKTRGPLTSTVLAIVALDDGFSLLLYGFTSSIAAAFIGGSNGPIWTTILMAVFEIFGAIILGVLAGFLLSFILKRIKEPDKALAFIVSSVLLVIGLSMALKLGSILAAMTLGVTIANLASRRRTSSFELMEKFAPPIYVLFFVLAGAHLVIGEIAGWMIVMVLVYLIGRTAGKILGSWFGARQSQAADVVRRYLGLCLLSQAGVAIGLAIISSQLFAGQMGHAIIVIVMTTTIIVEIFGPIFVKVGVKKAGEIGLNISEEDLIKSYNVADVMDTKVPVISAGTSLSEVIKVVSGTSSFYYPVVDNDKKLIGAVTLDGIRNTFATQELNDWLVALDIMEPIVAKVTPNMELSEAFEKANRLDIECVPVAASSQDDRFVGVLDCRAAHRSLSAEVLSRQQKADSIHKGPVSQ